MSSDNLVPSTPVHQRPVVNEHGAIESPLITPDDLALLTEPVFPNAVQRSMARTDRRVVSVGAWKWTQD